MENKKPKKYILGLDIGANSVGWAVVEIEETNGSPVRLVDAGSRVFEIWNQTDLEQGKEESKNKDRRTARLARRRLNRVRMRIKELYDHLMKAGLLPRLEESGAGPDMVEKDLETIARNAALAALDRELADKLEQEAVENGADEDELNRLRQVTLYLLRAKALDRPLEPFELGRALYHLAQRRGFLSNRKAPVKEDEEVGVVAQGITHLEKEMEATGARTLGEYFSRINPATEGMRIRTRWTSRQFYLDEFKKIWESQKPHHPSLLTDGFKEKIHGIIFYQRPLKSQKHLIGDCELEKGAKCAPKGCLEFQNHRMLQTVNHTEVLTLQEKRKLTQEERDKLVNTLTVKEKLTFPQAKKLLGLKNNIRFNMEEGEDAFFGNRTAGKIAAVIGEDRWRELGKEGQENLVHDLMSIRKPELLTRRGETVWGLDPQAAQKLAQIKLEDKYANLSRRALRKLLPHLEKGLSYTEARLIAYPEKKESPIHKTLPPMVVATYQKLMPQVRNPIVFRTLAEIHQVVNNIIGVYDKPAEVRIELARDLRNSKGMRKQIHDGQKTNRQLRAKAVKILMDEMSIHNPSRADVEKFMLWDECGKQCPYTGRPIGLRQLFGQNPEFDVEHIIPFSRSLDDSFFNKTLCWADTNRNIKQNRTPWEAFHANEKEWEEMLKRVEGFRSGKAAEKARRFRMNTDEVKDILENFTSTQLNDTRYASSLAMDYLGLLYGGQVDEQGKRRVMATRGQVTAYVRNQLHLNGLLDNGGMKTRDDHRHHAVDALATALTDQKMMNQLSRAASQAYAMGRKRFAPMEDPWPKFMENVRKIVDGMAVSHRVNRRLNGPLHEETIYSPPEEINGKTMTRVRKSLASKISEMEINDITDPRIRQAVQDKLAELGGGKDGLKKLGLLENHPRLATKKGASIPIHRVTVWKTKNPITLAEGTPRERHVASGSNHHLEVYEVLDTKGNPQWQGVVVNRYEAMRRKRDKEDIVRKDHGPGTRFLFTLAPGEMIQLKDQNGKFNLYRIRTYTQIKGKNFQLWYVDVNDARIENEIKAAKQFYSKTADSFRKAECRKVTITPLGKVRWAND